MSESSKKVSKKKRGQDDDSSKDRPRKKKSKSEKKHKKRKKSHRKESTGKIPTRLLNPDTDYFLYHKQLCLYLDEKGLVFDELSGKEARKMFSQFCQRYNAGKLNHVFYQTSVDTPTATTRHAWSFQTSVLENERLRAVQHSVKTAAAASSANERPPVRSTQQDRPPQRPPQQQQQERRPRTKRQDFETVAEQYGISTDVPSAVAQRREAAARTHGAARHGGHVELTDDSLYGSDQASFRAAVAAQKQRASVKHEKKQARLETLQEKEAKRQRDMLEMLGLGDKLKAGDKIKIAPRRDGV